MKINSEEKLENQRNMLGMIEDYKREYSRFPTLKEFEEKLNMAPRTVSRYKSEILVDSKKKLLDKFHNNILLHVEAAFNTINENVKIFEKIRDESDSNDEKMIAAKNILESHLDAVRIINDAPEYLGLDYDVSNEQEHIHRKTDKEKIKDPVEHTFTESDPK